MIVQNVGADGIADISFTVLDDDLPATLEAAEAAAAGARRRRRHPRRRRRQGLGRRPGHGHADRRRPADVPRPGRRGHQHPDDHDQRDQDLGARRPRPGACRRCAPCTRRSGWTRRRPAPQRARPQRRSRRAASAASDAVAVVARLQKMEELTIDDIALDETQARVTISGVPDQPGIAAAIFDAVADGGIFVDMIVQSFGREGKAKLSFTVPQTQSQQCARAAAASWPTDSHCGPVTGSPQGRQALGLGHRHAQPHRRGDPHVPTAWPRPASTSK